MPYDVVEKIATLHFVYQQVDLWRGKPINALKHLEHLLLISLYLQPKILGIGYKIF